MPTLNPLLTLFAAAVILGEPLTARKLSGAGIALIGQVLLFWTLVQAAAHDPARLLGDLYYLVSAVLWSAYTILGRIASKRFSPMAATTIATASGAVMLLPFALWQYPGSTGYTLPFWGHILYLALGATVGAFFLWSRGIERMGASRTAICHPAVPVMRYRRSEPTLAPGSLEAVDLGSSGGNDMVRDLKGYSLSVLGSRPPITHPMDVVREVPDRC